MLHSLDAHNEPNRGNPSYTGLPGHKLPEQSVVWFHLQASWEKANGQWAEGGAADCYAALATTQECASCFQDLTPKFLLLVAAVPLPYRRNHS